ncbi:MAG: hypothetical protein ABF319_03705 [Polaribacter sp.]
MKTKNHKILKTLAVFIFMGCSVLSTQAQIYYVDASAKMAPTTVAHGVMPSPTCKPHSMLPLKMQKYE